MTTRQIARGKTFRVWAAAAILIAGGVTLALFWRSGTPNEPTIPEDTRSYELVPTAQSIDVDLETLENEITRQIYAVNQKHSGSIDRPDVLRRSVRRALEIYIGGSLESLRGELDSPAIAPLPNQNSDRLAAAWETYVRTFKLRPIDLDAIEVRMHRVDGEAISYAEPSAVTAERPGRIIAIPDPQKSEADLCEVVLPMSIVGSTDGGDSAEFPGRFGMSFVYDSDSQAWHLYRLTAYGAGELWVIMPPL